LTHSGRRVSAGRVGRVHGRDGSFYVERPDRELEVGTELTVAGQLRRVERCDGTAERPLLRLSGVSDRAAAAALRGERLLVAEEAGPRADGEWLAEELVGLRVEGLGVVRQVLDGPSCAVLELEGGTLLPFVADAIRSVDPEAGLIRADLAFLGDEALR
jgi:16S rRNA processing protein RimM